MLSVRDISKNYENRPLLKGLSFDLEPGQMVCLLGASGSGKSTLLRIIAGLEEAESGAVYWDGKDLAQTPVHKRGFGLMFQDYALFPHRTVYDNIAFGLRMQNRPADEIDGIVQERLRSIRMESFAHRAVTDLSGGEQQRVALARALAPNPRLLMLDEPLGALDHSLREQLTNELRQMLRESHKPVIYVTHDRQEAFGLADRLLVLHEGRIVQDGSPQDLYNAPADAWVAQFLGLGNLVPDQEDADCTWLLRPHDAALGESVSPTPFQFKGKILDCVYMGERYQLKLRTEEGLDLFLESQQQCPLNENASVYWLEEKAQCLRNAS